jgi:hypothetical protein
MKKIVLSDEEYEALSDDHVANPPTLSGRPGFITTMRQKALIKELVSLECANLISIQAEQESVSPSVIIENAIKFKLSHTA